MDKVAIVTDSSACLPRELAERFGISVVPIDLIFEGRVYRNGLDAAPSEFYSLLQRSKKLPTTSAPSAGTYLELYRELSKKARGILCITIPPRISAMFEAARLARQMVRGIDPDIEINVLDSGTAAMAQGFVVLAAAEAAAAGKNLEQVTREARRVTSQVNLVAMLDTLYYLAKGGRIPKVAAWAGSLLSVKPIMQISQGEVGLLEKARTKPRAVERLLDIMGERIPSGEPVHAAVLHTNVPEEAERLKERVASRFNCVELYVTEFTPVMGAHLGPGLLGLAFYHESQATLAKKAQKWETL